jgi:hypothetical protein
MHAESLRSPGREALTFHNATDDPVPKDERQLRLGELGRPEYARLAPADAARSDADAHLTCAEARRLEVRRAQRPSRLVEDERPHCLSAPRAGRSACP